jgi:APA family basic amino acid/polyamine antiporter
MTASEGGQAKANLTFNQDNLKRTIGLPGALSVSINQIVGGGIVSLTGAAIAMTGGGVAWAYVTAVFTIILVTIPYATIGAALPSAGAQYVYPAKFLHPTVGFVTAWMGALSHVSLSLYGLSAGEYLHAINPWFNPAWVALALVLIFYIANMMGASISARVGVVMLVAMVFGFLAFIIYGLQEVNWAIYPETLPNGFFKMLQAAALLTFATGGSFGVAELGREMKNPGRDIPLAMIGGTAVVGVLYVFIALPAAGVLPVAEVADQPLSKVAEVFMPHGLWVFFIIAGAMLAVVSTMNAQMLWGSKSLLAASDDGWLPKWFGSVNKRFGTPHIILTVLFLVGIIPTITGFDISAIGSAASAIAQVVFIMVVLSSLRLRYVRKDLHRSAPFKIPAWLHWGLVIIGVPVCIFQIYLLARDFTGVMWLALAVWSVLAVAIAALRYPHVRRLLAERDEVLGTMTIPVPDRED